MNRLTDTVSYRFYAALGAGFFLAALVFARSSTALFYGGAPSLAAFVGVIVVMLIVVWVIRVALRPARLVEAVATIAATSLVLDGAALALAPSLYGLPQSALLRVAAWLLTGSGAALIAAILLEHRRLAPRRRK